MVISVDIILEIENLVVRRGDRTIVNAPHLAVRRGDLHTLIGLNGAGKSTIAYAVMGIIKPDSGRIIFEGRDITDLGITERARLGITLAWQEPARFEGITVGEYLSISAKNSVIDGGDDGGTGGVEKRVYEAMKMVALDPEKYLDRELGEGLSGGERKRIELAAVYLMRPKLAILDEPDSGIDMMSIYEVIGLIKTINAGGTTILLITHRQELAEIADRATLICAGSPVLTGTPVRVGEQFEEMCWRCSDRDFRLKKPGEPKPEECEEYEKYGV